MLSAAEEAEKRVQELRERLDQDKDGKPDVVEKALEEAKKALEEAKARLAELDQDQDGIPDRLKVLSESAKKAAETAKAKAEEAARLLRERLGKDA
ncbi:hypothetical protein Thermus72351_08970 [Thermus brockianus]